MAREVIAKGEIRADHYRDWTSALNGAGLNQSDELSQRASEWNGSQSNALTPSRLLRLSKNLPHDWKEQRCFLGFAA
jgi:hypothetical protein